MIMELFEEEQLFFLGMNRERTAHTKWDERRKRVKTAGEKKKDNV